MTAPQVSELFGWNRHKIYELLDNLTLKGYRVPRSRERERRIVLSSVIDLARAIGRDDLAKELELRAEGLLTWRMPAVLCVSIDCQVPWAFAGCGLDVTPARTWT